MGYESRYVYCIFRGDNTEIYAHNLLKIYRTLEDAEAECDSLKESRSIPKRYFFSVEKWELL